MLIDKSYFFGDLQIAQPTQTEVADNIDWFINKYEPKLLTQLLGYQLYKDLKAGMLTSPVDQKWLNLLFGVEYTNKQNKLTKWNGLIITDDGQALQILIGKPADIVVDRARDEYDPASGTSTTIIPDQFIGTTFIFSQRGIGPFRNDEYSISGNILTLLNGVKFSRNDTFFYLSGYDISLSPGSTVQNKSLIANYIYYWYQKDQQTTTVGSGEVNNASQNATNTTGGRKAARAWNEMAHMNRELYAFLEANRTVYPEYDRPDRYLIQTVNVQGI